MDLYEKSNYLFILEKKKKKIRDMAKAENRPLNSLEEMLIEKYDEIIFSIIGSDIART